jgi:hypothetical protein
MLAASNAKFAPAAKNTLPPIVPLPPSTAADATVTALAESSEPFTSSLPADTVVAPV